jgi:hypothetical protein
LTTTCLMGVAVSELPAAKAGLGRVPTASRAVSEDAINFCKEASSAGIKRQHGVYRR